MSETCPYWRPQEPQKCAAAEEGDYGWAWCAPELVHPERCLCYQRAKREEAERERDEYKRRCEEALGAVVVEPGMPFGGCACDRCVLLRILRAKEQTK